MIKCAECGQDDPCPKLICLGTRERPPAILFWLAGPTGHVWITTCRECEKALARAIAWDRYQEELDNIESEYDIRGMRVYNSTMAPVNIPPQAARADQEGADDSTWALTQGADDATLVPTEGADETSNAS